MPEPVPDIRMVLDAASFAARAHRHQVRKDGQTPYAAHPFRVCLVVRHVFGIDDPEVLAVALLHDTVEDTTTDFDDLADRFGARVARWVGALSKDKRLPDHEREEVYIARLAAGEPAVKVAKLADIFDNLSDSRHLTVAGRRRTVERSRKYLAAVEQNLPDAARPAFGIVRRLLDEFERSEGKDSPS